MSRGDRRPGSREEERDLRRWGSLFLALSLLALGTGGCRLIGAGGPGPEPDPARETSVPMPRGLFQGFIEVEGGRVDGGLTLTPRDGSRLEGFFEAPPDLMATGSGRMDGDEITLQLRYEGACPGRMTLEGSWEAGVDRLSGVVRARDCTGQAQGTFLFNRY